MTEYTVVAAGNLYFPTRTTIESLGWKINEESTEKYERWEATKDDITVISNDMDILGLLGLIKLVEMHGPEPWKKRELFPNPE